MASMRSGWTGSVSMKSGWTGSVSMKSGWTGSVSMKLGWTDSAVQAHCGNLQRNEFTRNWSQKARSQSYQLAEPLWTDPGVE